MHTDDDRVELNLNLEDSRDARAKEIVERVMDELSDNGQIYLFDELAKARRLMENRSDPAFLPFKHFARPSFDPPSFALLS